MVDILKEPKEIIKEQDKLITYLFNFSKEMLFELRRQLWWSLVYFLLGITIGLNIAYLIFN